MAEPAAESVDTVDMRTVQLLEGTRIARRSAARQRMVLMLVGAVDRHGTGGDSAERGLDHR